MKTILKSLALLFSLTFLSACKSDFDKYWEIRRGAANSPITELETLEGFRFDMNEEEWVKALGDLKSYDLNYETYYDWQLGNSKYAGYIYKKFFYEGKLCYYEIWIDGKIKNGELKPLTHNDINDILSYYKDALKKGTEYLTSADIHYSFNTHIWSKGNLIIEILSPASLDNPIMIKCENLPAFANIKEKSDDTSPSTTSSTTSTVEVKNSLYDGSVKQVKEYLKYSYLRDPDSYESIEWSEVKRKDDGFYVRHKYRAKNGFGGYVIANQLFHLDFSGNVVDVKDLY